MAGIDSYTKLMLHCNGEDTSQTFTDSAITPKTVTAVGTAQIDTAVSKFGGASGMFDGDSDYLSVPDSDDWNFSTGNFTIDFWFRMSTAREAYLYGQQVDVNNFVLLAVQDTGGGTYGILFYVKSGGTIKAVYYSEAPNSLFVINTWYHVAAVRNGTDFKVYVNGVAATLTVGTAISTNALPDLATPPYLGFRNGGGAVNYLHGYMDEIRISKGIARWTANFDVPTAEYTLDGGQMTTNKGFWGA